MCYKELPLLTAKDIDVRIGMVSEKGDKKGVTLLLYKNARIDMQILDNVYGPMNWKREHQIINGNLFCTVSVWDEAKNEWVSKQDVGTESKTEAEKGLASDSFKRACVNWGIGRELYNAPFIYVQCSADEVKDRKCYTKFFVKELEYSNELREYIKLVITDNKGRERYNLNKKVNAPAVEKVENKVEDKVKKEVENNPKEVVEYVRKVGGICYIKCKEGFQDVDSVNAEMLKWALARVQYQAAHEEIMLALKRKGA